MKNVRSAGAIIYSGNRRNPRYLLIKHRRAGHWDFARGYVEAGENDVQAARREIREETGLSRFHFVRGFFVRTAWRLPRSSPYGAAYKVVVFFLCESSSRRIRLSDEHVRYVWLSFAEARRRVTYKQMKHVLEQAHDFLRTQK